MRKTKERYSFQEGLVFLDMLPSLGRSRQAWKVTSSDFLSIAHVGPKPSILQNDDRIPHNFERLWQKNHTNKNLE